MDFCTLLRTGASKEETTVTVPCCPPVVTVTIRVPRREALILHTNEVCENQTLFSALLWPARVDKVLVCAAKPLPEMLKFRAGLIARFDEVPEEIFGTS